MQELNLPSVKDLVKSGIEGITDGAAKIIARLKADPTKVAEAEAEIEKLKIQGGIESGKISAQIEEIRAKELETVNQTIREEGKSEHWMVWSWRPSIGFTFCGIIVYNYIIAPALGLEKVDIPGEVWSAMLVILGAASAGRSFEKAKKG